MDVDGSPVNLLSIATTVFSFTFLKKITILLFSTVTVTSAEFKDKSDTTCDFI